MRKHCGNCAKHRKETNQFSEECEHCVTALLENGERSEPSQWRAKPMTNADRIRSMSDEELAKWIEADGWGCEDCLECKRGAFDTCDMMCEENCLAWLQQPAEEVHHE